MILNKDQCYLNSYYELALFKSYADRQFGSIFNNQSEEEVEKLFALMGLLAVGEHYLSELDKYFTNDYFKNALGINQYQRFNLDDWVKSPQFNQLSSAVSHVLTSLNNNKSFKHTFDFEDGRLDKHLLPIFDFVNSFLHSNHIERCANTGGFKTIDFNQELRQKFEQDGYLIIENFLSVHEVDEFKKITEIIAENELKQNEAYLYGHGNRLQRVFNILNKHEKFRDLLSCNTVVQILENIFARDTLHQKYYLSSFQANILNPGSEAQQLHVDYSLPDPLPSWLMRINVNFLLDDFTEDNGATMVASGSHKLLRKPTSDDKNVDLIKLIAPRGSLIIWTGHMWHKSGANNSDKSRTALLACFAASYMREIAVEENYLEVMSKDALESSSQVLQNMLGVNHGIKQGARAITIVPDEV